MKKVGIIYNARIPEAFDLGTTILHELPLPDDSWISPAENLDTLMERAKHTDLVITVGGDGTILRATRVTAPSSIPVLGINMGRLGFMTELLGQEAMKKLPFYLNGNGRLEERNMLQARILKAQDSGGAETSGPYHALNDAVLARSSVSRVVTVSGSVDGAQVTTFRGDAVILCTATGSTGYNLAVGGPILNPISEDLVLKPVAAHMGLIAGLVLEPSAKIALSIEGHQDAVLTIDGYMDYQLSPGDSVELKKSPYRARFLRANPTNHFYATLTRRLGFGVRGQ